MSSTPSISFSGLASGIDTTSVISQLVASEQKPITQLQTKQTGYNTQLSTWQNFNSQLSSLQTAAKALTDSTTYNTATATSSNTGAATITTQLGATLGDHSLTVTQLAQAQKVVSTSLSSGSTALGKTGSFTLNGKTVQVSSTDALTDIAVKINAAKAGVSATVVNVGPNDFRVTLTSTQTGTANAIAASDSGGTVLSDLGLISTGASSIRHSVSFTQNGTAYTGAASLTLSSATQSIGSLLGIATGSSSSAGTFHLSNGGTGAGNEADIALNLDTNSLSDAANAINQAGISGISAQVVTVPDANGNLNRLHQLEIISSGSAPSFTDTSGLLATTGILQNSFARTVTPAKDAQFNLDGLDLTRSTNTVNDVITGATVKLLSGTAAAPGTTTLSVSQNNDTIVQAVTTFVSAYNAIQDAITAQNKYTPPATATPGAASTSPALFGDSTLSQIQSQLSQTLTAVSGSTTLESLGITLDSKGDLQVASDTLNQALQADPNAVSNLFGVSGTSDSSDIQFLKAGPKSAATTGTGYAVNITQPATQSTGTAGTAFSTTAGNKSGAPETLTFGGALFPGSAKLTLPVGSTLQDTANLINSTSGLNAKIYASVDATHHLVIASQNYGAGTSFTVGSNQAADGSNSGIGSALTVADGVNVAGTINGETATGNGRTLIGNSGNAHTEGVQLLVTASSPSPSGGATGHVTVTHGVADNLNTLLTQILDPINGSVIGAENSLNSQISDAQDQITKIQAQVTSYQAYLTQMFSEMETRVSALQAQGSAFAASIGAVPASTSSSSSSSSSLKTS